jgi:hypothetical protein
MFDQDKVSTNNPHKKILVWLLVSIFVIFPTLAIGIALLTTSKPPTPSQAGASPTPKATATPAADGKSAEDIIVAPTKDYAYYAVKRYLEGNLNDPDSLQDLEVLSLSGIKKMPGFYKVDVSYRAKNGFGALVLQRQGFVITHKAKGSAFDWDVTPVKD